MEKRKLDIFEVLSELNNKNVKFYDSLTPELAKEFQPLIVNRWMSGSRDFYQVMCINEIVNPYIFPLSQHKSLLWKLMCIANCGNKARSTWIKPPPVSKQSNLAIQAIQQFYNYNVRDAAQAFAILSKEEVILIASELGWQPDKISLLTKELKNVSK